MKIMYNSKTLKTERENYKSRKVSFRVDILTRVEPLESELEVSI